MAEPERRDRFGDAGRLPGIERVRQAGPHIAEGAGPGAGLAHDHEGRVALFPALADVGAVRLLADGRKLELAHDPAGLGIERRTGRLHPDPGRLAGDRLVGPVRLFGVARARPRNLPQVLRQRVDDAGHIEAM